MEIEFCHDGVAEKSRCKCGANLQAVSTEGHLDGRTRYSFSLTHRRDGTPIKHLETKGAVLGILELGYCETCEKYSAVLDCTDDKEFWSALPKWEREM